MPSGITESRSHDRGCPTDSTAGTLGPLRDTGAVCAARNDDPANATISLRVGIRHPGWRLPHRLRYGRANLKRPARDRRNWFYSFQIRLAYSPTDLSLEKKPHRATFSTARRVHALRSR
jgi:hypothetical protein